MKKCGTLPEDMPTPKKSLKQLDKEKKPNITIKGNLLKIDKKSLDKQAFLCYNINCKVIFDKRGEKTQNILSE